MAAAIAKTLLPGDVLLLDGDLGAGKTTFTQGLARAMGVGEPVTSPTFTLVRSYPTAFGVELIHVDVYRLDTLAEIVALGLPEMLEDGAVAAIEWGETGGAGPRPRASRRPPRPDRRDGERRDRPRTLGLPLAGPLGRPGRRRRPGPRPRLGASDDHPARPSPPPPPRSASLSGDADGPMASLQVRQGRRHAELLAPAIETLTRMAGIGTQQIGRVAVDIGPGLFTGLRVGVATAKALAPALDMPIVGCSSLDLLAYPHRRQDRLVASVIDAKRGEVFWALFRPGDGDGVIPLSDATVSGPDALVEALRGHAGRGAGRRRRRPPLCRRPRPVAGRRAGRARQTTIPSAGGPASNWPPPAPRSPSTRSRRSTCGAPTCASAGRNGTRHWRAARTSAWDLEVHLVPLRRRHLRSVLRIEAQVYPRPGRCRCS